MFKIIDIGLWKTRRMIEKLFKTNAQEIVDITLEEDIKASMPIVKKAIDCLKKYGKRLETIEVNIKKAETGIDENGKPIDWEERHNFMLISIIQISDLMHKIITTEDCDFCSPIELLEKLLELFEEKNDSPF